MNYSLFVSCPKGLEYLLGDEIKSLGLNVSRISPQGVFGQADLTTLYQLCLWSRIANRVQLILFSGEAHNPQILQQLCQQFPWQTVFSSDKRIAIEFHGSSRHFRNAMFGAQVVKDGIVDHFRQLKQNRPDVDKKNPQIRLHAHLDKDEITVSLDLTGYSLHQRGYRLKTGGAPLKENLAAAMLIRAGWPELAKKGYGLTDPFCGSGTLVIEAAMMAANIAPGILRDDQAFSFWTQHQSGLWNKLKQQALQQIRPINLSLSGSDQDAQVIRTAKENAARAGVGKFIQFSMQSLSALSPCAEKGLLITNPPYGERMGEINPLIPLYQQFGQCLYERFQGWEAAVLTSNTLLAKAIGLRSNKQYSFYNGPIACKLYCITLDSHNRYKAATEQSHSASSALRNRLQKNWQHLQKWASRNRIHAFRLYDADLPDYAFAVDWYDGYAVVQEYAPPASIPTHKAEKRTLERLQTLPDVLNIQADKIILKERRQQKGRNQYQKLKQKKVEHFIKEGQTTLKVNLSNYLDTGLFLDHRPLRLRFAQLPAESRFLNCFCYTASASVHAALAGAITTNVDLSNTYLRWAEENFRLNHLDVNRHQFIQFDCTEWLKLCRDRFDTIFLDPPSFSNSKRMASTLDIQRDHVALIKAAMRLLNKNGRLYFSTNLRSFKLSPVLKAQYQIKDISQETIDEDFKRNQKIHYCFDFSSLS